MSGIDDLELRIAKLEFSPGDVLVIQPKVALTTETWQRFAAYVKPLLPPGVKALFIEPGTELSVLTRAEIEARSA